MISLLSFRSDEVEEEDYGRTKFDFWAFNTAFHLSLALCFFYAFLVVFNGGQRPLICACWICGTVQF